MSSQITAIPQATEERDEKQSQFRHELKNILNKNCAENGSNTPDFILADYLMNCLHAFDSAVASREKWYGRSEE